MSRAKSPIHKRRPPPCCVPQTTSATPENCATPGVRPLWKQRGQERLHTTSSTNCTPTKREYHIYPHERLVPEDFPECSHLLHIVLVSFPMLFRSSNILQCTNIKSTAFHVFTVRSRMDSANMICSFPCACSPSRYALYCRCTSFRTLSYNARIC